MQKIISAFLLCFILTQVHGQSRKKVSTYLFVQNNHTIYDQTAGNNPWGIGLGLQTFFNNKTKFKPTMEFTADVYLEDDKVLRLFNDKPLDDVPGMVNFFVGSSYHPTQHIYLSFLAGPSFINGKTHLGAKPSLGLYFSKNKRWTGKVSYLNIFNPHCSEFPLNVKF